MTTPGPSPTARRRRRGPWARVAGFVVAVAILLVGIWWGGRPNDLRSPLRGGFFESRNLVLVNQALNVLTTRYYRRLNRSNVVDGALTGMVASLDDWH
jgi:ferric-dicitrate binding protein FerR (iron transport regulator)